MNASSKAKLAVKIDIMEKDLKFFENNYGQFDYI